MIKIRYFNRVKLMTLMLIQRDRKKYIKMRMTSQQETQRKTLIMIDFLKLTISQLYFQNIKLNHKIHGYYLPNNLNIKMIL